MVYIMKSFQMSPNFEKEALEYLKNDRLDHSTRFYFQPTDYNMDRIIEMAYEMGMAITINSVTGCDSIIMYMERDCLFENITKARIDDNEFIGDYMGFPLFVQAPKDKAKEISESIYKVLINPFFEDNGISYEIPDKEKLEEAYQTAVQNEMMKAFEIEVESCERMKILQDGELHVEYACTQEILKILYGFDAPIILTDGEVPIYSIDPEWAMNLEVVPTGVRFYFIKKDESEKDEIKCVKPNEDNGMELDEIHTLVNIEKNRNSEKLIGNGLPEKNPKDNPNLTYYLDIIDPNDKDDQNALAKLKAFGAPIRITTNRRYVVDPDYEMEIIQDQADTAVKYTFKKKAKK